jgi:hypothetical protein
VAYPLSIYDNHNHAPPLQSPHLKMCTVETIKQLVKEICMLLISLSDAISKGSEDDKIWSVMNTGEGDTSHETFNRRFDALFGEDCCDSHGHLHYVRQGKLGMGLVASYLSKIDWTDFPLDLVELKLQRLTAELQHLQCISTRLFAYLCSWFTRRVDIPSPARALNLSAKLKDTANTEAPQLSFQRKAVQDFHSQQTDKNDPPPSPTASADTNLPYSASVVPTPQAACTVAVSDSDDDGGIVGQLTAPCTLLTVKSKAY